MMIYVSHPYDGLEKNKTKIEKLLEKISKVDTGNTYNSPALAYGSLYGKVDHELWSDYCIDLLMMCDKVYFFGNYRKNKDCMIELKMCKLLSIPYKIFKGRVKG